MAYLLVTNDESDKRIKWAGDHARTVTERETLDSHDGAEVYQLKDFLTKLHSAFVSCTEGDALHMCHSVKDGNGLEAMRQLMKRRLPKTLATRRTLLKAVISKDSAKRLEESEKNLVGGMDIDNGDEEVKQRLVKMATDPGVPSSTD